MSFRRKVLNMNRLRADKFSKDRSSRLFGNNNAAKGPQVALHNLIRPNQADFELQPPERSRKNSERAPVRNFYLLAPRGTKT
jgi:hypothetical protein